MSKRTIRRLTRRSFLLSGIVMSAAAHAQSRPVTLTDWLNARVPDRRQALASLVAEIQRLDVSVHAWAHLEMQPATGAGALSAIPFGVKDVIETAGWPTEYGSPIYKGRRATETAAIITTLRSQGAVLVGKTHTTAFAYRTPGPTRNPRDLAHTPGGSSSGSAAAVAAGMVPFAIGTQTGGSTIRPASYCGIAGFKPTYGRLPTDGVLPLAPSLDTLGFFTHTAADMLAFWRAIGQDTGAAAAETLAAIDPLPPVEAPMAALFHDSLARLRRAGLSIRSVDLTAMLGRLQQEQQTVMFYEGARVHHERYDEFGDRLEHLAELVRKGRDISADRYAQAKEFIASCRAQMDKQYAETPIVLLPAATSPAPRGLTYTGDSSMNGPWTALGTPAMTIPMAVGDALPLGLQLTAARGHEARLLQTAVALEKLLG